MNLITRWLISTLAVIITAYILPGVSVSGFLVAFVVAVVIGLINIFLRPLIIFLTLPITIMSMGLFLLVINALLILLAGAIVSGFEVANFWWALLFSLILSVVSSFLKNTTKATRKEREDNIIIQKGS
jgi:putative membrane protein